MRIAPMVAKTVRVQGTRRHPGLQSLRVVGNAFGHDEVFLLCHPPAPPVEIPKRLSSSLLPPSFASGRSTAAFIRRGTHAGAPFALAGA